MKSGLIDDGTDSPRGSVVVTSTEAATRGSKGAQGQTAFTFGTDMPSDVQLSEEQLAQLAKLREEAQKTK